MNTLIHLLDHYGYIVLFFSLLLELIIIPIPNEILMSSVGLLVYQGKLNLILSILSGGVGGIIGVSISYFIGYKLGVPFFEKYGHKIHMGPDKIEKISRWNKKFGKVLLIFSCFIPGVRHVTSIFSGVTRIPFRSFAIFSYIGVFLWVGTFITLGSILGPKWEQYHEEAKVYIIGICIVLGLLYSIYFYVKTYKTKIKDNFFLFLELTFKRFPSYLKIKLLIFFMGLVFAGVVTLLIAVLQKFSNHGLGEFNRITLAVIHYVLKDGEWTSYMKKLAMFTSWKFLLVVGILTIAYIFIKSKHKLLDLRYYLVGLIGALLLSITVHWLFQNIFNNNGFSENFPSREMLISFFVYIFFMYIFMRHQLHHILSTAIFFVVLILLALVALADMYLNTLLPSDIVAGYIFAAVWISLVILLLELSRLLKISRTEKEAQKTTVEQQ